MVDVTIIICFIIYIVVLQACAVRWSQSTGKIASYTLNGDLDMFLKDNIIFEKRIQKTLQGVTTNEQKCEWAIERMKELFQLFAVADNSIWPFQICISFIASIILLKMLMLPVTVGRLFTCSLFIFIMVDLPRRFYSFHRSALIANKGLNIYSYYYRHMKH